MNPPSASLKFLLLGFAALLAVASWCGYWLYATREAQARVTAFETRLKGDGIVVECAGRSWSGFPFRIAMRCAPLSVRATAADTALVIARAEFLAQAYDPDRVIAIAISPAELNRPQGISKIDFDRAVASYIGDAGDFAIAAHDISFDVPGYGEDKIDGWSANGSITENAVELHDLQLASGDVLVRGTGRFALDSAARPYGRIGLEIINLRRLLDRLADKGVISTAEIEAGLALLTLLGKGAGGSTAIDLRAEHGRLYFGPFRLGELPSLR